MFSTTSQWLTTCNTLTLEIGDLTLEQELWQEKGPRLADSFGSKSLGQVGSGYIVSHVTKSVCRV